MKYVPNYKTKYNEEIVPTLMKEFGYKSVMQAPRLEKIVINQGVGSAIQDKKILEFSLNEITAITGQKAVVGKSTKDVSNFKLRKGMPIGVKVTLRKGDPPVGQDVRVPRKAYRRCPAAYPRLQGDQQ